jgi:membrane protease YdiL (CAAX protease family)
VSRVVPLRSSSTQSTVPLAEVSRVVVGSRAEAKAVRLAAERAAKEHTPSKASKKPAALKPTPKSPMPAGARAAASDRPTPSAPARPRDTSGSAVAWTLVDAGAVLAIMLLALVAKNAVLALPQVALMPQLGRMAVRGIVLSAFYVAQIASFGWLAGRHGLPALEGFGLRHGAEGGRGSDRPSVVGSVGLVVGLLIACEAFSITYGLAMEAAGIVQPERLSSDLTGVFGSGPTGFVVAFALVAIAAPLAEEIAFRGIVLPAVGDRWGMWWGIGVSSLLYAAYHANLWLFVPTAVLGVALGWLTWTRRSLWPALVLHVLYNATAVAAAFATAR